MRIEPDAVSADHDAAKNIGPVNAPRGQAAGLPAPTTCCAEPSPRGDVESVRSDGE